MTVRRTPMTILTAALAGAATALALVPAAAQGVSTGSTSDRVSTGSTSERVGRLTNLDHLDFLYDEVTPPRQQRHSTYRQAQEPALGTLWTYADRNADGSFRRIGGGPYDAASDTYGQGAFNADDVARAAVVYVRAWQQTGDADARRKAYQMLRGLAYLQTDSGPDAGNVVLWMQPDGTLNPSAEPVELPDPSDSDASYWLARTVWALGEAYPAFRRTDPAFAAFLKQRLDLSIRAVDRQVLDAYGRYQVVDGARVPAWLIADGADASAEAVLGLAAYVRSGRATPLAKQATRRLAEGIAQMAGGDARSWPFGGVQPWALSRANWHAWASQMPAALAQAGTALGEGSFTTAARRDAGTFDPWLLTSGGPDNGRLPTRTDSTQIAYGIDSRLQSLVATGGAASEQLAGMVAAWYFGANGSGQPTYDPATGVTIDGVQPDGSVNRNSGAESTIHGLLSMLALDAHPRIAEAARTAETVETVEPTYLQAEDAALSGDAEAVRPASTWTGESAYGGSGYARLGAGSTARFTLGDAAAGQQALVIPVVDLQPGATGRTAFTAGSTALGAVDGGAVGPQGASPSPGALLPVTLRTLLPQDATEVSAATTGGSTRLDALWVQPLVTRTVRGGDGHGTALLRSAATTPTTTTVEVPGEGTATATSYDGLGREVARTTGDGPSLTVSVPAGGFTVVRR